MPIKFSFFWKDTLIPCELIPTGAAIAIESWAARPVTSLDAAVETGSTSQAAVLWEPLLEVVPRGLS